LGINRSSTIGPPPVFSTTGPVPVFSGVPQAKQRRIEISQLPRHIRLIPGSSHARMESVIRPNAAVKHFTT